MIINVLANGDIKNIVPENIYQGSNKANTIVLIAPFSASVTPTISFELPQTHEIKGGATGYLFNEPTEVSNTLNMWTLQVDEVLTQYYGDVKYQVKFVNSNNEVIATARGKFKVNEGVDFELPATPTQDVYELLLQNISNIRADFLNGWIEAHGIREYNSEFAYGLGSYVFGVVDNKTMFFRSLIENNKGNALTNTSAWKSIIIGINGVKVNGVEQPTDIDGNVELTVPTKLSELTDDIGVVKSDEENTFRGTQTFTTSILVKTHGELPYVELGATKLTPTGQNVEVPGIKYTTSDLQVYYLHLPIGGGIVARTKDITNALVDYYTKDEVNNLVSSIPSFDVEVVDNLPTENINEGIIYLVRKGEESPNLFDEYIYVNDKWELLGTQSIATNVTATSVGDVIEDTESIFAMVDGDKLKFELDADLTSKISKSLTVPMDAPSSTELVAVDSTNSQTMVEIGEGLRLENGVLSATALTPETSVSSVNGKTGAVNLTASDVKAVAQSNGSANNLVATNFKIAAAPVISSGGGLWMTQGQGDFATMTPSKFISSNNIARTTDKTTTISTSSTDEQYPSAKAVYDYVQSAIVSSLGGNY
jgi:hypothetical protein